MRRYAPKALLIALAAVPLVCLATIAYDLYWRPDPISPPPTELGFVPEFDRELTDLDRQWTLLFLKDNQVVSTDVSGENSNVVLDLPTATGDPHSELMRHVAISPTGVRIAVNVVSPPHSGSPNATRQILVVDTRDLSVLNVPIPDGDFELDWGYASAPSWLTDDVFVIKTLRFTGDDVTSEEDRFLVYDLDNLSEPVPFDLSPCSWSTVLHPNSNALLLASDCAPTNGRPIWAIDISGMRPASPQERSFFSQHYWEAKYGPDDPYHHPSDLFPLIAIEPVAPGAEGSGRFYEHNWFRCYLYLGDRLVRISDSPITFEAQWQAGLDLFIWSEGDHTYAMDREGHYRQLYGGVYIGRIPDNR